MERSSVFLIFIFLIMISYMVYGAMPSKYTKLEESFGGLINKSLIRFEYEKSPLQTIVYGHTCRGKTYVVRQYLKLYQGTCFTDQREDKDQNHKQKQDQNQNLDQGTCLTDDRRSIIIVCKEERDWINPETGQPYSEFNMCNINMIT